MHMHTIKIDFAISIKKSENMYIESNKKRKKNHITENASGTDWCHPLWQMLARLPLNVVICWLNIETHSGPKAWQGKIYSIWRLYRTPNENPRTYFFSVIQINGNRFISQMAHFPSISSIILLSKKYFEIVN